VKSSARIISKLNNTNLQRLSVCLGKSENGFALAIISTVWQSPNYFSNSRWSGCSSRIKSFGTVKLAFCFLALFSATLLGENAVAYEELVGHWKVVERTTTGKADSPTIHLLSEVIVYLPFFSGPPSDGIPLDEHQISAVFLIDEAKGTHVEQSVLENSLGVFVKGQTIRAGPKNFGHEFNFTVSLVNGENRLELRNKANRFVLKKVGPAPEPKGRGLVYPSFDSAEINELWKMWRQWWREHPVEKKQ